MSDALLVADVDPVVMLKAMACMMQAARGNLSSLGRVRLESSLSDIVIMAGSKIVVSAKFDIYADTWSIFGDSRLKKYVTKAISNSQI